ncbi:hypothetical protein PMAYCL1PPCAC_22786, partial [Pristionchus mayeri]
RNFGDRKAMGTLVNLGFLLCVIVNVSPQGIAYNSIFCRSFGINTATNEWVTKYKTMVANLNKDTTLKAQKTRSANFLNNNWKNLPSFLSKDQLASSLTITAGLLESRWRITTYLKGLLAKIKPKLATPKFNEIRNMLWTKDKAAGHYMMWCYDEWKQEAIAAIPAAAKKSEISKILANYEAANPGFEDDKRTWNPGKGFNKCGLA